MYNVLVMLVEIPAILIAGLPEPGRRLEELYPLIGVAVILAFYTLVAYLGLLLLRAAGINPTA